MLLAFKVLAIIAGILGSYKYDFFTSNPVTKGPDYSGCRYTFMPTFNTDLNSRMLGSCQGQAYEKYLKELEDKKNNDLNK